MAGKLSFSIAINLLTENFKRGTSSVKNGLRSMQMQVLTFAAALGAGGMGLSGFVSQLVTVARETSRVTTALKNVSGGMGQFADNQRFLLDMAKKYGLEINALTGNYAKFTAASQVSGMSMMDQRKIFESVSRACTAFGMSADDSNGVFLALSQMMSKGKISSEELRLQMGERLPIALQAMAKAAGVSVGELDKLMKQGKLMSKDVLPGFADALNEMIPNVDTDNLETSINHLKNAFTEFTNGIGIQSAYKGAIDWITEAVQSAGENIKNIVIGLLALITGTLANHIVKWWTGISNLTSVLEANAAKSNAVLLQATQQRIAAEIALETAKTQSIAAEKKARIALDRSLQKEQLALTQVASAEQKAADLKKVVDAQTTAKLMIKATQQRVAAEIALETAKMELVAAQNANRQAQTYNETLAIRTRLQTAETDFASAEEFLAEKTAKEVAAQEAAKAAAANKAAVKSQNGWVRFCNTTKVAVGKLVVSLRALWSTFAPMIIVSAIVAIIGKFVEMSREAERVKNIFSEYKKGAESITHTPEIIQLHVIRDLYNKAAEGSKLKEKYQNRIVELLGGELKKNQDINDAVAERIKLLEATAKVDYFTRQKIDAEEKLKSIYNKRGGENAFNFQYKNAIENRSITNITLGEQPAILGEFEEAVSLRKIMANAEANLYDYTEFLEENKPKYTPIIGPDNKETPLKKAEEEYANKLKEYANQRDNGALKEQEYNKAIDELNEATYKKIGGLLTPEEALLNETYAKAMLGTYNPRYDESKGKAGKELEKVEKEYQDSIALAKEKMDRDLLSQQGYNDAIIEAAVSAANSAIAIDGIGKAADSFIEKVKSEAISNIEKPVLGKRDATFDYKKSDSDKISGELDVWKKYKNELEDLKDKHKVLSQDLQDKLNNAIKNVDNLEDALNLSEIKEDIKQLSKDLDNGIYSGVKESMSVIDGLVSSFKNLDEVFDPKSEASEWEKLLAVWSALTNAVDSFMSICKMVESLTDLTDELARAKKKEATIDTTVTAVKVANASTGAGADIAAAGVKKTTATENIKASTAEGAADAGKGAAKLPFPWNIVAIGGAIAAAIAAFALIPKFATGGVVGGSSYNGDKILARLNSGELVLNKGQQSKLSDAIDSQRTGSVGVTGVVVSGVSRVKGDDIYLSLSNHVKRTGKKSPWK